MTKAQYVMKLRYIRQTLRLGIKWGWGWTANHRLENAILAKQGLDSLIVDLQIDAAAENGDG
jgi:hypothetical protein